MDQPSEGAIFSKIATFPTDRNITKSLDFIPGSLLPAFSGYSTVNTQVMLENGEKIRKEVWKLSILGAAVKVFQEIASNRDWHISGKPRAVSRAVDWLNNARTTNPKTGEIHVGFERYLQSLAIDFLCVGRTSRYVRRWGQPDAGPLQYIDTTRVHFVKSKDAKDRKDIFFNPVEDTDYVWRYSLVSQTDNFPFKDIRNDVAVPFGVDAFVAPIAPAMLIAYVGYLVDQHESDKLDGQVVKDVLITALGLEENIMSGIAAANDLFDGPDRGELNIPVVGVAAHGTNDLNNLFTWLGLSRLPDSYDPEQFSNKYANIVAAVTGMAIRHFWQNTATGTNRAAEIVQEARGQQKGPATFIRKEERLINQSGMLETFSGSGLRPRFGFVEEIDLATRKANADILLKTSQALGEFMTVFGATISPEAALAWMQTLGVMPKEMELVDAPPPQTVMDESSQDPTADPNLESQDGNPAPTPLTNEQQKVLKMIAMRPDYGEITMNHLGEVVDKRAKWYTFSHHMLPEFTKEVQEEQSVTDEDAYAHSKLNSLKAYTDVVRSMLLNGQKDAVLTYIENLPAKFKAAAADLAVRIVEPGYEASEEDFVYLHILANYNS